MYSKLLAQSGFSAERLAGFCEVADAGSMVRAAGGDPVRQSLLSRQIRELEGFFGVDLIRRKGRGIELTDAGRELAAVGRQNFRGLADFRARCAGLPFEVKIAASNSVAYWLLLPRLPLVPAAVSRARLQVHHAQTRDAVTGLRDGTYDLALVRDAALGEGLRSRPLGTVGHSLYIPRALLASRPRTLQTALGKVPLALPVAGAMREFVEDIAARAGVEMRVAVGCSTYLHAAQVLRGGICAAVLPDIAPAAGEAKAYHRYPIGLEYRLCVAWSPRNVDTRPALLRMIDEMAKVMAVRAR